MLVNNKLLLNIKSQVSPFIMITHSPETSFVCFVLFLFFATQHYMQDLSSLTRDQTRAPCSLNHWTTREFPLKLVLTRTNLYVSIPSTSEYTVSINWDPLISRFNLFPKAYLEMHILFISHKSFFHIFDCSYLGYFHFLHKMPALC